MENKSLLEIAYAYVSESKNPVSFKMLWKHVVKEKGLTEDEANNKVGQFYTQLLLDGRFVTLGENKWDLRARNKFEKVHIDMKDVYNDVETADDDNEEATEEKEYNEAYEEKVIDRKDEIEQEVIEEEDNPSNI